MQVAHHARQSQRDVGAVDERDGVHDERHRDHTKPALFRHRFVQAGKSNRLPQSSCSQSFRKVRKAVKSDEWRAKTSTEDSDGYEPPLVTPYCLRDSSQLFRMICRAFRSHTSGVKELPDSLIKRLVQGIKPGLRFN